MTINLIKEMFPDFDHSLDPLGNRRIQGKGIICFLGHNMVRSKIPIFPECCGFFLEKTCRLESVISNKFSNGPWFVQHFNSVQELYGVLCFMKQFARTESLLKNWRFFPKKSGLSWVSEDAPTFKILQKPAVQVFAVKHCVLGTHEYMGDFSSFYEATLFIENALHFYPVHDLHVSNNEVHYKHTLLRAHPSYLELCCRKAGIIK